MAKPPNVDNLGLRPENSGPITVMNELAHLSAWFEATRPNNTTAYTALDVFADANVKLWTFQNMARNPGGSGYITKVQLFSGLKTDVDQYRLHIYAVPPATLIADNSPYLLLYVDIYKRLGIINLPAAATEDSTNSTMAQSIAVPGTTSSNLPMEFTCAPGDRNLYAVVETVLGHTPAAFDKLAINLITESYN